MVIASTVHIEWTLNWKSRFLLFTGSPGCSRSFQCIREISTIFATTITTTTKNPFKSKLHSKETIYRIISKWESICNTIQLSFSFHLENRHHFVVAILFSVHFSCRSMVSLQIAFKVTFPHVSIIPTHVFLFPLFSAFLLFLLLLDS